MATSYGGTTPADNIRKGGKTQPRPEGGGSAKNPGGSGAVPAVVGGNTPTIRKADPKNGKC